MNSEPFILLVCRPSRAKVLQAQPGPTLKHYGTMTTTPHKGAAERQTQPPPFSPHTTMSLCANPHRLRPQDSAHRRLGHCSPRLCQHFPSQLLGPQGLGNSSASGLMQRDHAGSYVRAGEKVVLVAEVSEVKRFFLHLALPRDISSHSLDGAVVACNAANSMSDMLSK
ncbi:hypothetical protein R3P38DRAFT_3222435 [Favolaschia claudopus]|uniref:Uncharacterized protein n=1 Tax=Favolaschia claudopus TaxID=2862362 RepID=A0AAW0A005_9AGAR